MSRNTDENDAKHEPEAAVQACRMAGMHLMNALRYIAVDPAEIDTQQDALDRVWEEPWAYDVWSAWHACRIALRNAGWDESEISMDTRKAWRTSSVHRGMLKEQIERLQDNIQSLASLVQTGEPTRVAENEPERTEQSPSPEG